MKRSLVTAMASPLLLALISSGCTATWQSGASGVPFLRLGPFEGLVSVVLLVGLVHRVLADRPPRP